MKNFKDKVAVITGAGSGMGRELALQLAAEGCNIALVEWKEDLLNETKELLKNHNVGVSSHLVDVSDKEVSANGVHVVCTFNGWDPSAWMMTDDNQDGIYSYKAQLSPFTHYEYKFVNGNSW